MNCSKDFVQKRLECLEETFEEVINTKFARLHMVDVVDDPHLKDALQIKGLRLQANVGRIRAKFFLSGSFARRMMGDRRFRDDVRDVDLFVMLYASRDDDDQRESTVDAYNRTVGQFDRDDFFAFISHTIRATVSSLMAESGESDEYEETPPLITTNDTYAKSSTTWQCFNTVPLKSGFVKNDGTEEKLPLQFICSNAILDADEAIKNPEIEDLNDLFVKCALYTCARFDMPSVCGSVAYLTKERLLTGVNIARFDMPEEIMTRKFKHVPTNRIKKYVKRLRLTPSNRPRCDRRSSCCSICAGFDYKMYKKILDNAYFFTQELEYTNYFIEVISAMFDKRDRTMQFNCNIYDDDTYIDHNDDCEDFVVFKFNGLPVPSGNEVFYKKHTPSMEYL